MQRFPCPCCGLLTLTSGERGSYEICEVCFWEDDGVQFRDPSYRGGANVESLEEARANYNAFGACDRESLSSVRAPRPEEIP